MEFSSQLSYYGSQPWSLILCSGRVVKIAFFVIKVDVSAACIHPHSARSAAERNGRNVCLKTRKD